MAMLGFPRAVSCCVLALRLAGSAASEGMWSGAAPNSDLRPLVSASPGVEEDTESTMHAAVPEDVAAHSEGQAAASTAAATAAHMAAMAETTISTAATTTAATGFAAAFAAAAAQEAFGQAGHEEATEDTQTAAPQTFSALPMGEEPGSDTTLGATTASPPESSAAPAIAAAQHVAPSDISVVDAGSVSEETSLVTAAPHAAKHISTTVLGTTAAARERAVETSTASTTHKTVVLGVPAYVPDEDDTTTTAEPTLTDLSHVIKWWMVMIFFIAMIFCIALSALTGGVVDALKASFSGQQRPPKNRTVRFGDFEMIPPSISGSAYRAGGMACLAGRSTTCNDCQVSPRDSNSDAEPLLLASEAGSPAAAAPALVLPPQPASQAATAVLLSPRLAPATPPAIVVAPAVRQYVLTRPFQVPAPRQPPTSVTLIYAGSPSSPVVVTGSPSSPFVYVNIPTSPITPSYNVV
eukprot:TRINITY_DN34526_c0_g1_i1.p1 TRINITY_DN34526_c0_g1~~TRINITY_DN34526_c0_g1_i1.p1  ORF type:complete len:466 (-),score=91.61 TRINITY_DN34526_c0_g1_i1:259-1656(-)